MIHASEASATGTVPGWTASFTTLPCRTSAESSNSTDATYPLYSIIAFSPSLLTIRESRPGESSD